MAKTVTNAARQCRIELPRVELLPVTGITNADPLRIKEIGDLVAKIILNGKKRGRPSMKDEDAQNAA